MPYVWYGEVFDPRLHEAVRDGDVEAVAKLIKEGLNINANDDELVMRTPLELTIFKKRIEIVKILLKAGADPNMKCFSNPTPLQSALNQGHLLMSRMLIDAGADVNMKSPVDGNTALHLATLRDNIKAIKNLLAKGANVNLENNNGHTPLQLVTGSRYFCIGRLLVDVGADVDSKIIAWSGKTLLHLAVSKNDSDMLEYLLSRNADVNATDQNYQTPLQFAFSPGNFGPVDCDKKIVLSLLKNGADLGKIDYTKFNTWNSKKILKILLQYSDTDMLDLMEKKIFKSCKALWKSFLVHLAKLEALEIPLKPGVFKNTTENKDFGDYFDECKRELSLAKSTQLGNSWVTYFNVLTGNKKQLKNYAGNQDLVDYFEKSNCESKFPIYGISMVKNMTKGVKRRELFDNSTDLLFACLPIYNPTHLIIRDILDRIDTKELSEFCK